MDIEKDSNGYGKTKGKEGCILKKCNINVNAR